MVAIYHILGLISSYSHATLHVNMYELAYDLGSSLQFVA